MGRHSGPACKQCRREGDRLFLKGDRCNSAKCALTKRNFAPGMHGKAMKKHSDYAIRLREKQKLKRIYGISEKQLRKYYEKGSKALDVTGTLLLQLLETRLDNVIFRLGLAASRKQARQLVKHAHFLVNGKKVSIPSYAVKPNDKISIKENSLKSFEVTLEKIKEFNYPAWISFNTNTKEGALISVPEREEIDYSIDEQLIVEYYAR